MYEWKDKMTTRMPSRTSRNCVKIVPEMNISVCHQMAIAVMSSGMVHIPSGYKIWIFMIILRSERDKDIFRAHQNDY